MIATPPYEDIAIAIGDSDIVSIGDAIIGKPKVRFFPRSVLISTSLLDLISEYRGTNKTSSYETPLFILGNLPGLLGLLAILTSFLAWSLKSFFGI